LGSIEEVFEVVAHIRSLPYLLAVFGAATSIGGAIIGVFAGKPPTWRQLFDDVAAGATVGGALGCLLVFVTYLLTNVIGA
jgi:hypothetical protein